MFYGMERNVPQLRHCVACGVEWSASIRRCWVCGRFGPTGKTPGAHMSSQQAMAFDPNNNEEDPLCHL